MSAIGKTQRVKRRAVGCAVMGKNADRLVVVCDDGTAWMWAEVPPKDEREAFERMAGRMNGQVYQHDWTIFHSAIPGTAADRDELDDAGPQEAGR